jgi:predicted DNA-binding protein
MKKTSVYLGDAELAALRRLAEREGKPQALVLREAIAAYDAALPTGEGRKFAVEACGESNDGRSAADIPEEEYLRGFGE